MFEVTTEHVPLAISLVDMQVAGLPLLYVNAAWERLTGYARAEVIGRNCRMLQGESTEESSIAQIVHALRDRRSCSVIVSNYKKSGARFRNALTLHPVSDSDGAYRYVIGLASDADAGSDIMAFMRAALPLLPACFPASFRVHRTTPVLDKRAQDRQYTLAMMSHVRQELLQAEETGVTRALCSDLTVSVPIKLLW